MRSKVVRNVRSPALVFCFAHHEISGPCSPEDAKDPAESQTTEESYGGKQSLAEIRFHPSLSANAIWHIASTQSFAVMEQIAVEVSRSGLFQRGSRKKVQFHLR